MHKIDLISSVKLENQYQNFLESLVTKGPEHIEMLELWDSGMQFQVIFTKQQVDNNAFTIENQNNFEQRMLYRIEEEPRMTVSFTKQYWQLEEREG